MADLMMRQALRGPDGKAKAQASDANGNAKVLQVDEFRGKNKVYSSEREILPGGFYRFGSGVKIDTPYVFAVVKAEVEHDFTLSYVDPDIVNNFIERYSYGECTKKTLVSSAFRIRDDGEDTRFLVVNRSNEPRNYKVEFYGVEDNFLSKGLLSGERQSFVLDPGEEHTTGVISVEDTKRIHWQIGLGSRTMFSLDVFRDPGDPSGVTSRDVLVPPNLTDQAATGAYEVYSPFVRFRIKNTGSSRSSFALRLYGK